MHSLSVRLAFASFAIVVCAVSSTAQPQSAASPRCPAGYWLMKDLCLNGATGDVVNAEPPAASQVAFGPGCAPGYWRLDSLCFNDVTGDVELVNETRWPAEQRSN
jgi:hypothetical protein